MLCISSLLLAFVFAEMANFRVTFPKNYDKLDVLGYGSYGYVFKCFKNDTKETVAVKVLKQRDTFSNYKREVSYYLMIIAELL